jgi:hypothetical protein
MVIKICNYPLEYFIYIIIFILVLTIIISLFRNNIFSKKVIEKFDEDLMGNSNTNTDIDIDVIKSELEENKKELELSKLKEEKLKVEVELIKNYIKIDDTDFANIHTHALKTFFNGGNITIPILNDTAKIIDSNENLNLLISKTSSLKNIYKVGEKVLQDSTFYITNNDICYSNVPLSERGLYTGCTVCSINPSNNFMSNKNKTNIESVCLYNDSENKIDKTIPTSTFCEGICIGRT